MPVTKKMLREAIKNLAEECGIDFSLNAAYGYSRIDSNNGSKIVCNRMPNKDLMLWIEAFSQGFSQGLKKGKEAQEKPPTFEP